MEEEIEKDAKTILIVDDEQPIVDILVYNLRKEGYNTIEASDGITAVDMALEQKPDLILLDIMLPKMDGLSVCKRIKNSLNVPILMLTAKDGEIDKILGLELGADDYITKPFSVRELVARVKAVLRRYQPLPSPSSPEKSKTVSYPDLEISLTNYSVIYQGSSIEMPPKELELLYFLASSPNQVFTREQLLDHIWGYEYMGDTRTVDVHIKRLREKIKDHASWHLATVWGIGYKFEVK